VPEDLLVEPRRQLTQVPTELGNVTSCHSPSAESGRNRVSRVNSGINTIYFYELLRVTVRVNAAPTHGYLKI
jgi:hypothetical protein